jgi:uncharacterized protein YdeI (YjbR/CyaY-like superfamily)
MIENLAAQLLEVIAMGQKDKRVDAYIAKSADFARPILIHFRKLVHTACPDVEETMKWSFPHFDYKGMMCSMASFKSHCALGFWKASLVLDGDQAEGAMGHFGRITSLKDLPSDRELTGYIKKAAKLNEDGIKVTKPKTEPKKPLKVPSDFAAALGRNVSARKTFEGFSPSNRREYVEWITEAKTDATRQKRLATSLEWLAEGKVRNWKYVPK